MPFLPENAPSQRLFVPCVPTPSEFEQVLPLMSSYRRVIEYFGMLASRQGVLKKGMATGPLEKCIESIDRFEQAAADTFAAIEAGSDDAEAMKARLQKSLAATRGLLDLEIRKHAEQTGLAIVTLRGGKIKTSITALEPGATKGKRVAMFFAVEADEKAPESLQVDFQGRQTEAISKWAVPLVPGGLTPFAVDFTMGKLADDACVVLSDGKNEVKLPVRCTSTPPATLKAYVIDSKTGKPLACRVSITDSYGQFRAPIGARVTTVPRPWGEDHWGENGRFGGEQFFYTNGSFELDVPPGKATIRVVRGFEHQVYQSQPELKPGQTADLEIALDRWIDMPAKGWRVGQTHMHTQDIMPVNDSSDWQIVPDAEGLEVSFLSTFQQFEEVFSEEYPIGLLKQFSRDNYFLLVGEEFRHVPYGHMTFLNLKKLVPPISTGHLGGAGWPDKTNAEAIEEAHDQNAVVCYCHLDAGGPGSLVQNDELPIDCALGLVDCGEVMGAGGGFKYWYPMLNCGLRIGAAAGPDWNLEDTCRTYVFLGEEKFTVKSWMEGLRAQRTFVTCGPILFLTVNGQLPGAVIKGKAARDLTIKAQALSPDPLKKLEIIMNGEVVASAEGSGTRTQIALQKAIAPEKNSWLAARCYGQGTAHTSPVYIQLDKKPMGTPKDAAKLLEISERCIGWTERYGNFKSEHEKKKALALLNKGADFYRQIAERKAD